MTDLPQEEKKPLTFDKVMWAYFKTRDGSEDRKVVGDVKLAVICFRKSYHSRCPTAAVFEKKLQSALGEDGTIEFVNSLPKHWKVYGAVGALYKIWDFMALGVLVEDERNDLGLPILRDLIDKQVRASRVPNFRIVLKKDGLGFGSVQ